MLMVIFTLNIRVIIILQLKVSEILIKLRNIHKIKLDCMNILLVKISLCQKSQRFSMSSTFDQVATIIAETCDIPRDTITPESHAIDDLGIDSLDFLDIAFAIDKAFGIKLPLEKWTQEVNDGKATRSSASVRTPSSASVMN